MVNLTKKLKNMDFLNRMNFYKLGRHKVLTR